MNPVENLETGSFKIETFTKDDYPIAVLDSNLTINFICEYPCKTCDQT